MTEQFERGMAFGPYVLEARLGGGGFGIVWRAREEGTGRLVALKILAGKFSAGETGRLRADVELLAAAASAESPNVVKVLGGGPDPAPHVVMEFIDGANLEDELERQERLSQAETLRILRGIAEALAVLHGAGIIHRDVKPANVMLARDGTVKLTDFGIAKIAGYESVTATGQLPLSAAYAAPEVWGGEATYQSDFYALGALAFQCLTGVRPFSGNFVQLFEMHRNRDPEYALLPGETVPALRQLIVRCLAKDPMARPESAEALLAMVSEAERQMESSNAVSTGLPTHEPRALGPWLIEAPHPTQPWAFACLHETTGERATVEVHFSDSLELGESLRRAVAANPQLVPLGAERLLGTKRLILRPGEAWSDQPHGRFMFWVARQELPAPHVPALIDDGGALATAAAALRLVTEARNAGLDVGLHGGNARAASAGAVYVTRVGLPGEGSGPVVDWLRAVLPGTALFDGLTSDDLLAASLELRASEPEAAVVGVAHLAETGALTETEESSLLERSGLSAASARPPVTAEPPPALHRTIPPPPATQPRTASGPPHGRTRRTKVALFAGVSLVALLAIGGVAFALSGSDDEPRSHPALADLATNTAPATARVTATVTRTLTATPMTATPTPSATPTLIPSATPTVALSLPIPTPATRGNVKVRAVWGVAPVEGVVVHIGELQAVTNAVGEALFLDLVPGPLDFAVEWTGEDWCSRISGGRALVNAGTTADSVVWAARCVNASVEVEGAGLVLVLDPVPVALNATVAGCVGGGTACGPQDRNTVYSGTVPAGVSMWKSGPLPAAITGEYRVDLEGSTGEHPSYSRTLFVTFD
ncbi:MAG: hypothetical protein AMXMBFR80_09250 [Dehalococcoidia bacterium]